MPPVTEQDNELQKFDLPEALAFSKELWAERISDLPAPLLDYLVTDHFNQMVQLITPMVKRSETDLLASLGAMALNGQADWYVEPTKALYAAVNKLSKGFQLNASGIAQFFKDDNYVGSDMRSVVLEPEIQPVSSPADRMGFTCAHFTKACRPLLPDNFLENGNKDLQDTAEALAFVDMMPWNAETANTTPLVGIYIAQKWKRVMPIVSGALLENRRKNLVTIADKFTQRFKVIERNAVGAAMQSMRAQM